MSYSRWLLIVLSLIVATAVVIVGLSYSMDVFGVFRDARGRNLSVHVNERTAKYLLNENYVPQNFDGLLIGSSVSANWNTDAIDNAHVYNESIDGGNATEERLLVEQALPKGHFKFALCLISPFITRSHILNEGGMGKPSHREALGSINILREEWAALLDMSGLEKPAFFPNGSKRLDTPKSAHPRFPAAAFNIDRESLNDYKSLISELRTRGVRIIFVSPPMAESLYVDNRRFLDEYIKQSGLIANQDAFIDFNSDSYSSFRSHASNFDDGIHLSEAAAQELSSYLSTEIRRALGDGAAK